MSSVVVLWLMLGHFYFSYLIRIVVFFNRYRSLLPKSPHSDHNTVNKSSTEQSIELCQHPGEGTHIHVVEQVRPQGIKKKRTKQRNKSQQLNLPGNFTRQYRTTIQLYRARRDSLKIM
jgi:hypothetical protein